MKRLLAFLLILALLAGAVGTSAFAAPGNSGKVHWKDQLIMDWEEMMEEYLALKDELEDEGSLDSEDQARFDELEELLTADSQIAKKFYLALRNRLNNKHYSSQNHVQNTVRVMNQFRNNFPNWDVLPFNSIISHKYNFIFDTPPMLADGRTLVPVRALVEALDAYLDVEVEWIPYYGDNTMTFGDFEGFSTMDLVDAYDVVPGDQTADEWLDDEMNEDVDGDTEVSVVKITVDDLELDLFIGYPVAYIDDDGDIRWEALDTQPEVFSDRTYVPLRFIVELLDLSAYWDDGTIVIDDADDDDEDPVLPSDIERDDSDVTQDPITEARYKLDVDFDASDYDVVVQSADGIDDGTSIDKMTYFEDEPVDDFELNGYYVGLAIEVPDEVDDDTYVTDDVILVEWDNEEINSYMIAGDELYVYLPVTEDMEKTSPNLEIRWELDLDKEYFDVELDYLRFADEPIEETVIERYDNDVRQFDDVGGADLDFDFDGEDKELFIDGEEKVVPYIEAGEEELPKEAGNYVGIRVDAPDDFDKEDLEYVAFNLEGDDPTELSEDEYDINDNRLVYYLEIDPEDEGDELELTIKWAPEYVEETIEIRWVDFTVEEPLLVAERAAGSVHQDPENTGGIGLYYAFDLGTLTLTIVDDNDSGRYVQYYDGTGTLVNLDDEALSAGYWVGIKILRPTNYDGDEIAEITVDGDTEVEVDLDGTEKDQIWIYFEAETGEDAFDIEILWAEGFETETITVNTDFDELTEL